MFNTDLSRKTLESGTQGHNRLPKNRFPNFMEAAMGPSHDLGPWTTGPGLRESSGLIQLAAIDVVLLLMKSTWRLFQIGRVCCGSTMCLSFRGSRSSAVSSGRLFYSLGAAIWGRSHWPKCALGSSLGTCTPRTGSLDVQMTGWKNF